MTAALGPVWLRSGPVTLRPWTDADAPVVLAALHYPEIVLWNGSVVPDLAAAEAWVRRRADWSEGDHASFAISATAGLALLGSMSLHEIDPVQGDAEIGYWVAAQARGHGLAARAVTLVCRWAFAVLPVDRIELAHAVENTASGRVAERAGFTLEGRLRRSYRYGDGVKHDELLWSRLREDGGSSTGVCGTRA